MTSPPRMPAVRRAVVLTTAAAALLTGVITTAEAAAWASVSGCATGEVCTSAPRSNLNQSGLTIHASYNCWTLDCDISLGASARAGALSTVID
ncbi:hypothetical protein [Streptomyces sp. NBC_00690]|uniref:hypothetical protein n=1 Tax=Streptomyces sp. NBC_00690 TaxID=2975808 RepID=UPI002E2D45D3|nr:hypothetical protein [Streptomyces sp. NBC_00690]